MPGFGDTAVIALIALLLFGPKKLPVLARQLGKLMAEFRRASNEFRSQMEEELRIAEQADRQKEVAALEAASANKIESPAAESTQAEAIAEPMAMTPTATDSSPHTPMPAADLSGVEESDRVAEPQVAMSSEEVHAPTPIATSGDLTMMPPETGLPLARSNGASSIHKEQETTSPPASHTPTHDAELETETLHG